MQQRCVGMQGGQGIENRLKRFHLETDPFQGDGQNLLIFGNDQGHRITAVADALVDEYRLVLADHPLTIGTVDVRRGQYRADPGDFRGIVGDDAEEMAVRDAGTLDAGPEQADRVMIDSEPFFAAHFGQRVRANHRLADRHRSVIIVHC